MKLLRRLRNWLRPKMPVVNILLVAGCYIANEYFVQGFCQPVPWAAWVLAVSTSAFLAWPWLKQVPGLNYGLAFLLGVHFTVCVYCTLFVAPFHLLLTLLTGFLLFPLLLWVPVLFAAHGVRWVRASSLPGIRWAFGGGVVAVLLVQGWAWRQYREVATAVATLPPAQRNQARSLLRVVPRTYMAERLAGALFKYHSSPNMLDDGWRPPLHDPLANMCRVLDWGNSLLLIGRSNGYYVLSDINIQAALYHQLFPGEPVKGDCVCAQTRDGERY